MGDFDVFERLDEDEYSVFLDKSVLSLGYVPEKLVSRQREDEFFARILSRGVRENFLPGMIRVYGGTGCGKTVVVRSVLERFGRYKGSLFRFFYVNLKQCRTIFSAADAILSAISGERVPVNLGVDRVFSGIWDALKELKVGLDRVFVCLVLDEADSVFADKHYDPSEFFYRFLRHQTYLNDGDIKVCLIAIANSAGVLEERLDARVKSSMGSERIRFDGYSQSDLKGILASRAEVAFKPGCVEEGTVGLCAKLVSEGTGDARKAVDLLRVSGEVANERGSNVTSECVYEAVDRVKKDYVQEMLEGLPHYIITPFIILTDIIAKKGKTTTGEFYRTYNTAVLSFKKRDKHRLLSERRILDLINELEIMGLVTTRNFSRGKGGYGKEITLTVSPESILEFYAPKNNKSQDSA
jgi:cell division control protein 6